jgi:hypothetical protein
VTNEPTAEIRAPGMLAAGGLATGARGGTTGTPAVATAATGVPTGRHVAATGEARLGAPEPADRDPETTAGAAPTPADPAPRRRRRRWLVALLVVLLVAALGAAGYLYATTRAYAERLQWTEQQARAIGADLTLTRSELDGARAEIEALQGQLTTAQERITALADEKAQIGDDREAQRQLLDYQARVSEAAGTVASALDRCVQGQDQLIAYLEDAESYDPAQLTRFGSDVEALCQSASDANEALQSELADR